MYELIKQFEGLRLKAYADSTGIQTIGYGHTKEVYAGMTCTKEQADKWLEEDLQDARTRVGKAVLGTNTLLDDNEFEALVSLAYNLSSFEQLMKHIKKGKDFFLKKMLLYYKTPGSEAGLKRRRICERLLFEGKDWFSVALELDGKSLEEMQEKEKELFV